MSSQVTTDFHARKTNACGHLHRRPPVLAVALPSGTRSIEDCGFASRRIAGLFFVLTSRVVSLHIPDELQFLQDRDQFSRGFENFQFDIRKGKCAYGMATAALQVDNSRRFRGRELYVPWIGSTDPDRPVHRHGPWLPRESVPPRTAIASSLVSGFRTITSESGASLFARRIETPFR